MSVPRDKIRIIHCIGSLNVGGAEKQLAELICRLPRERFEQSLVLLNQDEGPLVDRVRASGCEVVNLRYLQRYRVVDPRFYLDLAGAIARFVRHLKKRRTQIVHAQLYWANILGVVAGRLAGVPRIVTSRLSLSNYKEGRPMMQRLENLVNRWTTDIFANSGAVKADCLAHEKVDPNIIHIIYNGVVLEDFERPDTESLAGELGISPNDLVLTEIANLHPYKGHDDLLRAMASLLPRHPNLKAILPGRDQGMRARLEEMIRELKLEDNVILMGERRDVARILALADIVVHPSHTEGFSNSILEGMTAGKPLVVSDVGGNPEAVIDGENGYIVPAKDWRALAEALDKLIATPALRARMGAASRRRIETEFSMARMIERFSAWYEEMAQCGRP